MRWFKLSCCVAVLGSVGCQVDAPDLRQFPWDAQGGGSVDAGDSSVLPTPDASVQDSTTPLDAPTTPHETSGISVHWKPDNSVGGPDFFAAELTLTNHGTVTLGPSGWKLFFSTSYAILDEGSGHDGGMMQDLKSQGLRCSHADDEKSGDYFVLEPTDSFAPLAPGQDRKIQILAANWSIQKTDAPAGFHILLPGQTTPLAVHASVEIDVNDPKQTTRFSGDVLPAKTSAVRYQENADITTIQPYVQAMLVPMPLTVTESGGTYELNGPSFVVQFQGALGTEAGYLASALMDVVNASVTASSIGAGPISLRIDPTLDVDHDGTPDAEGYNLAVNDHGVVIVGTDAAGVFYGIQTLRQLIPADAYAAAINTSARKTSLTIPKVVIWDAPLFHYRGMHLDVARHFQSKDTVLRLLDLLAHHKINKFHFHLSDDEGFRLEIPGLPELTEFGGHRVADPAEGAGLHPAFGSTGSLTGDDHLGAKAADEVEANGGVRPTYQGFEESTVNFIGSGSGFYSVADFDQIIKYAAERHIDVIPEFDMPAHARAMVRSMEARYRQYAGKDDGKANEFRLVDPNDASKHTSVQGYVDNLMNPCLDTTYAFIKKIITEVKWRFDESNVKLVMFHAGGDEPPGTVWWASSPACQSNAAMKGLTDAQRKDAFFTKVASLIAQTGATVTGWDDIVSAGLNVDGFVSMPWSNVWGWGGEDQAYKEANAGKPVILAHATNLYMDLAYEKDPDEPGYYWANFVDEKKTFEYLPFDIFSSATQNRMGAAIDPSTWAASVKLTDAGKKSILGMEGLLWGENAKTPELVDYLAFPKILGVAERAWNRDMPTPATLPARWNQFVNTLGQAELPRLDGYRAVDLRHEIGQPRVGVNYRIPPPGAIIDNGQLKANIRYPGLAVEYSTDNGTTWTPYSSAVAVSGTVILRSKTTRGTVSRSVKVH